MFVRHMRAWCPEGEKEILDPLGLGLPMPVSQIWVPGIKHLSSGKSNERYKLLSQFSSPLPIFLYLFSMPLYVWGHVKISSAKKGGKRA